MKNLKKLTKLPPSYKQKSTLEMIQCLKYSQIEIPLCGDGGSSAMNVSMRIHQTGKMIIMEEKKKVILEIFSKSYKNVEKCRFQMFFSVTI